MAPVAYFGGLEQTFLFFVGKKGVCPALAHLVGDESGLLGDGQRKFHKKREINNKCIWAELDAECEPYSLFRHLIPQKPSTELTKEEQGRF